MERLLYEMCLEASSCALTQSTQPYAVDSQNAVQILRLIQEFLSSRGKVKLKQWQRQQQRGSSA